MQNDSPVIFERCVKRTCLTKEQRDDNIKDEIDSQEVFEMICGIYDPEYTTTTLEELNVVRKDLIIVDERSNYVFVRFTPTIPHCSMAAIIGLSIKVMLQRFLPPYFKIKVLIEEGTHVSEKDLNKQLNDKERVAAALENPNLLSIINKCLNIKMDLSKLIESLKNNF